MASKARKVNCGTDVFLHSGRHWGPGVVEDVPAEVADDLEARIKEKQEEMAKGSGPVGQTQNVDPSLAIRMSMSAVPPGHNAEDPGPAPESPPSPPIDPIALMTPVETAPAEG